MFYPSSPPPPSKKKKKERKKERKKRVPLFKLSGVWAAERLQINMEPKKRAKVFLVSMSIGAFCFRRLFQVGTSATFMLNAQSEASVEGLEFPLRAAGSSLCDDSAPDLAGTMALVPRGECSFYHKAGVLWSPKPRTPLGLTSLEVAACGCIYGASPEES